MSKILRDGATVYQLDPDGVNKWSFTVQPGYGLDGHRQPAFVVEKVAIKMAAVDDLFEVLAGIVDAFDGDPGFGLAKNVLAKARGESA